MTASADAPTVGSLDGRLWIGGEWVDGDDWFDVADPSTGGVMGSVADARPDAVAAAVTAATAAGPSWAATPSRERSEILRACHAALVADTEHLAELMVLEMGKSRADARAEVAYAAEFFRWFADEAVRIGGELRSSPTGTHRILTSRRPVGVCLLLTPWNFPAAMATRKIAPALAAGCTVVLKPSEETPYTALRIARLLDDAGVPAGVVNVVPTSDPAGLVEAALADPRVRKVSFTGSTAVGRRVLELSAANVVRTSLELGGNAPFLVLEGADLAAAVDGALLAKLRNGGQACTAANRFLVQRDLVAEFTGRLVERMAAQRVGDPRDPGTDVGPLIHARAVAGVHDKVVRSVAAGALLVLGGEPLEGPGSYYPPTVLTDVPADAAVMTEEVFGPVAPVLAVEDEDEAVALANATDAGLAAYVYADLARGLRVAERLEAGMVGLNRGLVSDPAAPFGGLKHSGLGREGGFEGIGDYLETTYVSTQWQ